MFILLKTVGSLKLPRCGSPQWYDVNVNFTSTGSFVIFIKGGKLVYKVNTDNPYGFCSILFSDVTTSWALFDK
jgi:hypothetical protein